MANKKTSAEKLYDAMFDEAVLLAMEEMGSKMETHEEKVEFSEEHKKKMEKLFRKDIAKREHKIFKYVTCAACLILCVIVGSNFAIYKGDAWISKLLNYVFDYNAPNTKYNFVDNQSTIYEDEELYLGYVPSGFIQMSKKYGEVFYDIRFKNEEYYFHVSTTKSTDVNGAIDTEGGVVEDITINGCKGFYCEANDVNSVVWQDGKNMYTLIGNIPREELIKIAENAKKK